MKKVKITGSKRLGFEWWGDKLRGRIVDVYDYPYFTKKGKKYYEMVTECRRKAPCFSNGDIRRPLFR